MLLVTNYFPSLECSKDETASIVPISFGSVVPSLYCSNKKRLVEGVYLTIRMFALFWSGLICQTFLYLLGELLIIIIKKVIWSVQFLALSARNICLAVINHYLTPFSAPGYGRKPDHVVCSIEHVLYLSPYCTSLGSQCWYWWRDDL